MRSLLSAAVLPASLWTLVTARLHIVPDDPYAFPKYRVAFLNGLPVQNDTAQQWLKDGLRGGELEFLDQPWEENASWGAPAVKSIDGGSGEQSAAAAEPDSAGFRLELMKMGPRHSYICLIPPPPMDNTSVPTDDAPTDVTPVHTWSLLQPLSGTCLYHKQGWFTYSYCHNSHVRQFHEVQRAHPQRPGEYRPEEDTEWEAYTLGRAPPTPEPGADLTVAQEAAIAANIELARNAGSRYLVQRWGDGTHCEKIGRKREIEIQFHCSMTMTDTILFVKETQTCHYVLHIATPRLCGEPGFRSRHDTREEAYIRCREILSAQQYAQADRSLAESDHPFRMPSRAPKPVIAPPPTEDFAGDDLKGKDSDEKLKQNEAIKKAIAKLMAEGDLKAGEVTVIEEGGEEVVIEFIDYPLEDGEEALSLHDILREAGYDLKGPKGGAKAGAKDSVEGQEEDQERKKNPHARDEL